MYSKHFSLNLYEHGMHVVTELHERDERFRQTQTTLCSALCAIYTQAQSVGSGGMSHTYANAAIHVDTLDSQAAAAVFAAEHAIPPGHVQARKLRKP